MINSEYKKYVYFRGVSDEDNDDGHGNSITIKVSDITGILPGDASGVAADDDNRLTILFNTNKKYPLSWATTPNSFIHLKGCVKLELKEAGVFKETMRDLVEAFNGRARDNWLVIADDMSESSKGILPTYISKHISSVNAIKAN